MKKGSMNDSPHLLSEGGCGFFSTGTPEDYLKLGYVPVECDSIQSVSLTLEHAYDDFCVAQTAKLLGKSDDYEFFSKRSKNYTNNFNPVHGFMQEKDRNGNFMEPFDPEAAKGFCEADSWKYTWFVPHDVQGLIELIGGKDKFNARLDEFFEKGHYSADNEPDFHVPYLYVYSGEPWKTQKIVRELMQKYFTGKPDGLPGNDDAGATSSWYVLSAMGLYPVSPGHGIYIIGSPVFDRISIRLDPLFFKAKEFVIEAKNNSPENVYIQTATLNGMDTNNAWITHDEISQGGTLRLVMGKNPSQWGSTTPP
jgi:predicted alpha-1,2-mannosidase